jgi:hypothetical protein
MTDDANSKSEADTRTFSALLLVVVVATLLLALIGVILPGLLGVLLIVGGMAWFGVMHYLVWGWWLGDYLRRAAEREQLDEPGQ